MKCGTEPNPAAVYKLRPHFFRSSFSAVPGVDFNQVRAATGSQPRIHPGVMKRPAGCANAHSSRLWNVLSVRQSDDLNYTTVVGSARTRAELYNTRLALSGRQ